MTFDLQQSVRVVRSTPAVVRSLLADKSDAWVRGNYGPGTFSPLDVVGHLIHGDRDDWIPRARIILEHGTQRPFDAFDWTAAYEESMGRTTEEVLTLFERVRGEAVAALESLPLSPENLERQGTHPALGTVTLRQLLATWTVHDLHHIAQICKGLAHRYVDDVGPWGAYISILRKPAAANAS